MKDPCVMTAEELLAELRRREQYRDMHGSLTYREAGEFVTLAWELILRCDDGELPEQWVPDYDRDSIPPIDPEDCIR